MFWSLTRLIWEFFFFGGGGGLLVFRFFLDDLVVFMFFCCLSLMIFFTSLNLGVLSFGYCALCVCVSCLVWA